MIFPELLIIFAFVYVIYEFNTNLLMVLKNLNHGEKKIGILYTF